MYNKLNIGMNISTYELLFKDYIDTDIISDLSYLKTYYTIDSFTKEKDNNLMLELLECMYNGIIIDTDTITFNSKTNEYEYKDDNIFITFTKISDYVDNKELKSELLSEDRYCKCHNYALYFGPKINNSKIVTGYVVLKDKKVLHTVISTTIDDLEYILDFTKNLKITKKQYLKLTNFKEIVSFDSKYIEGDLSLLSDIDISIKTYTVFRNEIIEDLKRNINNFNSKGKVKK